MENRYDVIAQYSNGKNIYAYTIKSNTGKLHRISEKKLYELVERGQVNGYSITKFRGQDIITNRSNKETKTINVSVDRYKKQFKIVGELIDKYETVGYRLEHTNGKRVDIDNKRIIEYINKGFIRGVRIDNSDNTVIFDADEDIYNIDVYSIRDKRSIHRISVFIEDNDCKYDIKSDMTAIGELEHIAYEKDIYVLNRDIKVILDSFTYGRMQVLNITRHRVRIYNDSQIFDIRYHGNLYAKGRTDIIKLVLNGIQNFDMNKENLSISTYNNLNQLLARYTLI